MTKSKQLSRSDEISVDYFHFLDHHINEVVTGKALSFLELNEIASELAISHQHLSDTIQKKFGQHPCYFYDHKIIEVAKKMLLETNLSIAEVARRLTYDPSNFSKFFKKFTGETPGKFRKKTVP
ncbi:helix-turn-helix domain-containing protein [Paenimyroides aestuarii]|uniref:Helix-turn-helix domain-containing protein n=1 Tax=Paenimyroides aestuarii TaxID=2968490 RepID=A0ABY5NPP0_9FLAO|nr:helix-turn-helix domain-containing protein [Paenimyroides aestuarii]UUV20495.1 helix-turn-helix domain-containing protein [Paenimyroides aestuarii]